MTKKEAIAAKAAWKLALAEGRVVRFNNGLFFKSFKTEAQAQEWAARCLAEMNAEVLKVNT